MSRGTDLKFVHELESLAFRAWPAIETLTAHGWIQRLAGGYTKRANSINALEIEPEFSQGLRKKLERPYLERGLPPIWRLSPLAPRGADRALADLGYRRIDLSLVQRAPLGGRFGLDPEVHVAATPSPAWLDGFATLSPVAPQHREIMVTMLGQISPPVGFARVEDSGRPVAFALGVVEGDHVGIFDVLVAPAARRRGLARRLTQTICAWGERHGAHFAYLQVVATNEAALPLYARLGFETVYSYAYRVP
jgi:ribosomal protein S18 acetylase RimI-like enzyme